MNHEKECLARSPWIYLRRYWNNVEETNNTQWGITNYYGQRGQEAGTFNTVSEETHSFWKHTVQDFDV